MGDHDPRKPMSENTVNKALRVMGYDTKVEVCGHGFRTMATGERSRAGSPGRWMLILRRGIKINFLNPLYKSKKICIIIYSLLFQKAFQLSYDL